MWGEGTHPRNIYGKTTDFRTFQRNPRGYASWGMGDGGGVSVCREGDTLYLFTGTHVYTMPLKVAAP